MFWDDFLHNMISERELYITTACCNEVGKPMLLLINSIFMITSNVKLKNLNHSEDTDVFSKLKKNLQLFVNLSFIPFAIICWYHIYNVFAIHNMVATNCTQNFLHLNWMLYQMNQVFAVSFKFHVPYIQRCFYARKTLHWIIPELFSLLLHLLNLFLFQLLDL